MKIVIPTLSLLCTTRVLSEKMGGKCFLKANILRIVVFPILLVVRQVLFKFFRLPANFRTRKEVARDYCPKTWVQFFSLTDSKIQLFFFFPKLKVEIPGYGGGVFHCSILFFPNKTTPDRVGNFFERSRLISLQFWNTITTSHYLGSYDHSF